MLLLFLLLPLVMTAAEYAENPPHGNGGGVPPVDPHGGPPDKPPPEVPPAGGYAEGPAKPDKGPKPSVGTKGGAGYSGGPPPTHGGGAPKKPEVAYAEVPEPQQRAHLVQDQSPICPANSYFNICPPPRTCEPSCRNYYPTCVWNFCYRPRCTCYPGYYRRSGAPNAPCVRWQQCWRWGGPRWRPRPPRPGRPGPRVPWMWWMAG